MRCLEQILVLLSMASSVLTIYTDDFTPDDISYDDNSTDATSFLLKRWYSLPTLPSQRKPQDPYLHPWPVVCTNPSVQPVYYCYRDARSAKNLQGIVNAAIAKWAHAIRVTALTFELDPRAKGNPHVYCSHLKGDKDALVISDESLYSEDLEEVQKHFYSSACQTSTTVGYNYAPEKHAFRHHLKFCDLEPWDAKADTPAAVRQMTHELGHAIGLQHEHQRPDRNAYIWVAFKHMQGYSDLERLVDEDPENLFGEGISHKTKMDEAVRSDLYMKNYFPQGLDFLQADRFEASDSRSTWQNYEFSTKFDFDSIMIYDSTMGRSEAYRKKNGYVIMRKPDKSPVWMGGSKDLDAYSISEGDIARVAMLYDAHTDECEKAKKGELWAKSGGGPKALKIKIRGDYEEVVLPPRAVRKRDEL